MSTRMTRTGTGSFGVAFQGSPARYWKLSPPFFPTQLTAPGLGPLNGGVSWNQVSLRRGSTVQSKPQKVLGCAYTLFKDNMITVTTVQLMKSHDQLNLTLNSRQLNFITWMLRFYRTGNYTFYKKINGQKLQKRMPRIGNHWPLVPWLHCTNLCHSRRRRTFWSYNPCLQSYRNLCRIPLSLNIPLRKIWWLYRLFLLPYGLSNICQSQNHTTFRFC